MHKQLALFAIGASVIGAPCVNANDSQHPVAQTQYGKVEGTRDNGVMVFRISLLSGVSRMWKVCGPKSTE